jgi:hypothetical protein
MSNPTTFPVVAPLVPWLLLSHHSSSSASRRPVKAHSALIESNALDGAPFLTRLRHRRFS